MSEREDRDKSERQEKKVVEKLAEGVADLYLDQYAFTTTAAIVGSVDRKVFVLLRDGKHLFGILRTFDQFANLVLENCVERIYLDNGRYAERPVGVYLIRGENVVMLGEVDIDKEDAPLMNMSEIPFDVAAKEQKKNHESRIETEVARSKRLAAVGLISDFSKGDMY